jgi:hypothetical protein
VRCPGRRRVWWLTAGGHCPVRVLWQGARVAASPIGALRDLGRGCRAVPRGWLPAGRAGDVEVGAEHRVDLESLGTGEVQVLVALGAVEGLGAGAAGCGLAGGLRGEEPDMPQYVDYVGGIAVGQPGRGSCGGDLAGSEFDAEELEFAAAEGLGPAAERVEDAEQPVILEPVLSCDVPGALEYLRSVRLIAA